MKKLLVLFFILIIQIVNGQSLEWVKNISGSYDISIQKIETDTSGNIYLYGSFFGPVDFDLSGNTYILTGANTLDLFIAKYDTDGNFLWANKIDGNGVVICGDIKLDNLNNVILVGTFKSGINFTTETDTISSTSNGLWDIFIVKFDPSGNLLWAKTTGGTSDDIINSLTTDDAGNIITTGNFRMTCDFNPGIGTYNLTSNGLRDIFILKLTSNGNFTWAEKIGSVEHDSSNKIISKDNNVYLTGDFEGSVDFGIGTATYTIHSPNYTNPYILKFDTLGNFIWVKQLVSTAISDGSGLTLDDLGNIFISGIVQGTMDFDPGTNTSNYTFSSQPDFYIVKLDSNGDFIWGEGWGTSINEIISEIDCDQQGNVIATGIFQGTLDFDPSSNSFPITASGSENGFILKMSPSGSLMSANKLGLNNYTHGLALKIDFENKIITSGNFNGQCDFELSNGTNILTSSNGFYNGYFAKYNSGNLYTNEIINGTELLLYPNPAKDILVIEQNSNSNISIEILNIEGRLIQSFTSSEKNIQTDVSEFANGMYFIHVKSETGNAVYKLVKE